MFNPRFLLDFPLVNHNLGKISLAGLAKRHNRPRMKNNGEPNHPCYIPNGPRAFHPSAVNPPRSAVFQFNPVQQVKTSRINDIFQHPNQGANPLLLFGFLLPPRPSGPHKPWGQNTLQHFSKAFPQCHPLQSVSHSSSSNISFTIFQASYSPEPCATNSPTRS